MEIEVCVERLETALAADRLGAKRIELCSALEIGGLTPSHGIIESCVDQCSLEVYVMIRPHGGNFVYDNHAVEVMKKDIEAVKNIGAQGVVFGCLTKDNEINFKLNKLLLDKAKSLGLGVTFHRAFDFCSSVEDSLDKLIEMGFDRLLTSGQKEKAIDGVDLIQKLQSQAAGRIQLMAGSGVNADNASLLAATGIGALHFTARKRVAKDLDLSMGADYRVDETKISEIIEAIG